MLEWQGWEWAKLRGMNAAAKNAVLIGTLKK